MRRVADAGGDDRSASKRENAELQAEIAVLRRDHSASKRADMAAATPVEKEESQSQCSDNELEPGKSNPFHCNICKRSYSRVDHLARYAITPIPCWRLGLTILETLPLTFVINILHSWIH